MKRAINTVKIHNLWGLYNLNWNKVDPKVNIIVGINGSGKTTLINSMYSFLSTPNLELKDYYFDHIKIEFTDNTFIKSDEIKEDTQPFNVLKLSKNDTLFDSIIPRIKNLKDSDKDYYYKNIENFAVIMGDLMSNTKKHIEISENNGSLIIKDINNKEIALERLSAGEKRMLIFLYKVFLTKKQDYFIFLDEPELSLHVSWQAQLIDIILKLNPNAQLFVVTHSPNIFSNGWGDKLQFIEDFISEI